LFKISSALIHHAGVLLLRWTVAGLMLLHGVAKLRSGVAGIESMLASHGLPTWIAYGVFIGEIAAPLFVVVGVFVCTAALVMAFNMAVAVALAHQAQLFTLGKSGAYALELQAFFFLGSIAIALLANGRSRA
jgi:putative oxidoreductase